jgi:hypothetical protein
MSAQTPTTQTVFCCINYIEITIDSDIKAAHNVVNAINNLKHLNWPEGTSTLGQPIGDPAAVFVNGDLSVANPGKQIRQFDKISWRDCTLRSTPGLANIDLSAHPSPKAHDKDEGRNQMCDYIRCLYKRYRREDTGHKTNVKPLIPVTDIDAARVCFIGPMQIFPYIIIRYLEVCLPIVLIHRL